MMIEDRFFDQEFVQEMSNEDFRMLLYLLHFASKKTGIVELNMRMLNFSANTGKKYSIEEVVERFGKMIRLIPNRKTTAIFPSYIFINWMKNGIPDNVNSHPLYKSIAKELSSFGLTLEDVFEMNRKMKGNVECDSDCSCDGDDSCSMPRQEVEEGMEERRERHVLKDNGRPLRVEGLRHVGEGRRTVHPRSSRVAERRVLERRSEQV